MEPVCLSLISEWIERVEKQDLSHPYLNHVVQITRTLALYQGK